MGEIGKQITKKELALRLGISRSALYYRHRRPAIDEEVKNQIEAVLSDNPAYGHKRIALELKLNKKRILRVMRKYQIKPYKRRAKGLRKKKDEGRKPKFENLVEKFCPIRPDVVWAGDFTFIRFGARFIYLATVIDIFTREIVGWSISRFHNKEMIMGAIKHALSRHNQPQYTHSDQGSEYCSKEYASLMARLGVKISMSRKASPWENPFQESFYSHFKVELGQTSRFESLGELVEEIHRVLNYYNKRRIHSELKMPPEIYREKLRQCV
jgi:putative transposase